MSWSVYAIGKPAAVKEYLKEQFAQLKPGLAKFPHEHAAAALSEEIIDGQLNYLIERGITVVVKVAANSHAWHTDGPVPLGATQYAATFETVPGFVE